jgi:hypothetical protein
MAQQYVFILLTPEGFELLLQRLAATERANLHWFPVKVKETILDPLWSCREPGQLDEKEGSLGLELVKVCLGLAPTLIKSFGDWGTFIRLVEEVEGTSLSRARNRISGLLGEAVWDNFEWAWRAQVEIANILLPMISHFTSDAFNLTNNEISKAPSHHDPISRAFVTMQLYILGILAAAEKEDAPLPDLLGEFCHRAYASSCVVIDSFGTEGIRIDPYRLDTSEQRRERIDRTAGQVLSGLTEEQVAHVETCSLEHSTFFSGKPD